MSRLGEILLARGAVSADALRGAIEATRRNGGRVGTWLVRLGAVSEGTLLDALAEQTGCPPVTAMDLATAPHDVRSLIPPAFAKRHLAVAFARQGRTVHVAMINPNDLVLVDEIASLTRFAIRPFVATEAALAAALAIPVADHDTSPHPGASQIAPREWRQFWRLESSGPDVFRALDPRQPAAVAHAAASFPALAPLGPTTASDRLQTVTLSEGLASATHRDQVASLVLDNLEAFALRVALFSIHQGKVMGWAARGPEILDEDFHTLILPLDRPSVFLNLAKGVDLHAGPVAGGEGNELLLDALGDPTPKEAVIAPIRVRSRVVALLWLDQGGASVADISIADVQEVARLAGLALETLVIRQKIRSGARLTEGAASD
ncbi:MAG: hypothetical protein AB1625_11155 [Acidobacteriota bacterium]